MAMGSKRGAEKQMTHDNWDEEDEEEDAGHFQEASKDELQKRQFKRAKRRAPTDSTDSAKAPIFRGFAGFASAKPQSAGAVGSGSAALVSSMTAMENKSVSQQPGVTASTADNKDNEAVSGGSRGQFATELKALNESVLQWIDTHLKKNAYCILTPVFKDYERYLQELNTKYPESAVSTSNSVPPVTEVEPKKNAAAEATSVVDDKKPAFSFTGTATTGISFSFKPTAATDLSVTTVSSPFPFKAAISAATTTPALAAASSASFKPLSSLESANASLSAFPGPSAAITFGKPLASTTGSSTEGKVGDSVASGKLPLFGAWPATGTASTKVGSTDAATTGLFKFGAGLASAQTSGTSSLFQLGVSKPPLTGSIFGSSTSADAVTATQPVKSFLFDTTGSKPSHAAADDAGDNEEYVPPKPEVVNAVTEEGAIYTKRVKLFYQKEGSYVDKGVGNLFVKKVDNKAQLVVRADTNLGNILLNIRLTESIPVVHQGANNVSLVCFANPPMDSKMDASKPTTLLLRVKTSSDAEELAAQLNKHKQ